MPKVTDKNPGAGTQDVLEFLHRGLEGRYLVFVLAVALAIAVVSVVALALFEDLDHGWAWAVELAFTRRLWRLDEVWEE